MPDTSVRAADAAWVSFDRWHALTRQQQDGDAPICPEFVIEVHSKSDRLPPFQAKMEMWIANGAEVAWLIDPQRKTVEIYARVTRQKCCTSRVPCREVGRWRGLSW